MKDLARSVGSGITIQLGGRDLLLQPLTLKRIGVINNHLIERRRSALEVVKKQLHGLPMDMQQFLILQAMKDDSLSYDTIDINRVLEWVGTIEGLTMAVWLMARDEADDLSLDAVTEAIGALTAVQFRRLAENVAAASGLDDAANVNGPLPS